MKKAVKSHLPDWVIATFLARMIYVQSIKPIPSASRATRYNYRLFTYIWLRVNAFINRFDMLLRRLKAELQDITRRKLDGYTTHCRLFFCHKRHHGIRICSIVGLEFL